MSEDHPTGPWLWCLPQHTSAHMVPDAQRAAIMSHLSTHSAASSNRVNARSVKISQMHQSRDAYVAPRQTSNRLQDITLKGCNRRT